MYSVAHTILTLFLAHLCHYAVQFSVNSDGTIEAMHQSTTVYLLCVTLSTFILLIIGVFLYFDAVTYNLIYMFCQGKMYTFVHTLCLVFRTEANFYRFSRNRIIELGTIVIVVQYHWLSVGNVLSLGSINGLLGCFRDSTSVGVCRNINDFHLCIIQSRHYNTFLLYSSFLTCLERLGCITHVVTRCISQAKLLTLHNITRHVNVVLTA